MVRKGTLQDIEQVNAIRKEVNELHIKGEPKIFKTGFSTEMQEYVKQFIDNPNKQLWVVEDDGSICAVALIEFVVKPETPFSYEQTYLDLQELGTSSSCCRKGYGKQLIAKIKELAKERNVSEIRLNMWTFNEDALRFYEKMGFQTYRRHLRLNV